VEARDRSFMAWVVKEAGWREFCVTDIPGTSAQWHRFNREAKVRPASFQPPPAPKRPPSVIELPYRNPESK
jgi:hypothetical protein